MTSDLRISIADSLRALSGTLLHALVWWGALHYVAIHWQQPYWIWTQDNGFGLPDWLSQVLRGWDLVLRYPYAMVAVAGLGVVFDIYVMLQLGRIAYLRMLRDYWFIAILSLPLLALTWLGIVQIQHFLERQVDPYSMHLGSPEIEAEVALFEGHWHLVERLNIAANNELHGEDFEIIQFNHGKFEWNSGEMGRSVGAVYLEAIRDPKHIQFVAMHPDSKWTTRNGIYRFEQGQLVLMLPRWNALSLPPPLDFEWDDSRYETLRFVRENAHE